MQERLEDDGGGQREQRGTKIDIYSCNGTNAQKWTLTSSGELAKPPAVSA